MTENTARQLYVDLLQRTLSYAMWPEPLTAASARPRRKKVSRIAFRFMDRLLAFSGLTLARLPTASQADRTQGRIWPAGAHTMIGQHRLDNVRFAVETVLRDKVPGDLIETGVWRGGTCIFMRGILKAHDVIDRKVYVADSFAGLPPPDPDKYPADRKDKHYTEDALRVSKADVATNFASYGLLDDQVVFVEGFFENTLHLLESESFAVIRLDGDMYSSTMQALEALYPKLQPGGFCIIDDYALETCRKAVEDYRKAHDIADEIVQIDWTGSYWRKSR